MLDILAETLELGNVLRDGGGLAELADFSFGRDNQVGVAVDGRQGVGECVERNKLSGGPSVVCGGQEGLKPGIRSFPKVGPCEEDLRPVVRELGRFAGELELTLRQKIGEEKTVSLEILGVGDFHSGCWLFALFDEDLHSSLELVVLRLDEVETSFEITYISHRDLGDLVFFRWGGFVAHDCLVGQ